MTTPILKRLPIPPLEDTFDRLLQRIEPLQDDRQNSRSRNNILSAENLNAMRILQEKLVEYDNWLARESPESSYIEQFWYDSYLLYSQSVVLNVNPFFQLQDDPTINEHTYSKLSGPYNEHSLQIKRAAKLMHSVLKFITQIRHRTLSRDKVRSGVYLSMDQYDKLFGSSRIPPSVGEDSCHLQTDITSHHAIVMYKSNFYWFDVLDVDNYPIFQTAEELEWNLYSIIMDTDRADREYGEDSGSCTKFPFGVFTTESRRVWSNIRSYLRNDIDDTNLKNLKLIDSALFVLCLDDVEFDDSTTKGKEELIKSMLCGTSNVDLSTDPSTLRYNHMPINRQQGTCLNRWYDKLQFIVSKNGKTGINFEHTGVDGHTVLRLATDIYTDSILSFAKNVTKNVPDLFGDELNLIATPKKDWSKDKKANLITIPRKLEWKQDSFLVSSLHFAETRISDLISQYEVMSLDFENYGATHIKSLFKSSPDAFVQQIFQIAYYALYGKFESVYEPAMTKTFQNGRTEAIRSVTHQSKRFVKSLFDSSSNDQTRIEALHSATAEHSRITKECASGLGQDRHLYALYCIWKEYFEDTMPIPPLFEDEAWKIMNNNVLSTSNCGNPCLKSFGFGPVMANGFGIGYIIRDNSISFVVSSKHRQTKRFISLIEKSLLEVDRIFRRQLMISDPKLCDTLNSKPTGVRNRRSSSVRGDGHYLLSQDDIAVNSLRHKHSITANDNEQIPDSDNMRYLLSGYDYFDVSVTG